MHRVKDLKIEQDDPKAADVLQLLDTHLAFAREHSPPVDVHALDADGLTSDSVTFYSARHEGMLVGVGAIREIDASHGEIKSMHTAVPARGRGVGRAILEALLMVAGDRGYHRVSLETGSMEAFAPARMLYEEFGFRECDPFADYFVSPYSIFMTKELGRQTGPV